MRGRSKHKPLRYQWNQKDSNPRWRGAVDTRGGGRGFTESERQQPAVAGVKAKGKNKVITKDNRNHKCMSKDKGKGKDDVTKGMSNDDEERRAFLEACERDEACRKRDDALEAACLAYESDYSDAETL